MQQERYIRGVWSVLHAEYSPRFYSPISEDPVLIANHKVEHTRRMYTARLISPLGDAQMMGRPPQRSSFASTRFISLKLGGSMAIIAERASIKRISLLKLRGMSKGDDDRLVRFLLHIDRVGNSSRAQIGRSRSD